LTAISAVLFVVANVKLFHDKTINTGILVAAIILGLWVLAEKWRKEKEKNDQPD